MSAYAISLVSVCSGGNHVTIGVTQDGGATKSFQFTADDLLIPLAANDLRDTLSTILRIHCNGMTKTQAKSAIQAGFTVTI